MKLYTAVNIFLLIVVLSFPEQCTGFLRCYSCNATQQTAAPCDANPKIDIQVCNGHRSITYCEIQTDLQGRITDLGCATKHSRPKRVPYCEHILKLGNLGPGEHTIDAGNPNLPHRKQCWCQKDLCNNYPPDSLKCMACSTSLGGNQCTNSGNSIIEKRCLIDEEICYHKQKPYKAIGCTQKPEYKEEDKYNVKDRSFCIGDGSSSACYCTTSLCNTGNLYQPPPTKTTTTKMGVWNGAQSTESFSISIIAFLLLLSCSLYCGFM